MSIRLENVNFIYGLGTGNEKHALKNISLHIHDGEFVGLAGHTGSGKSTLLKLLNGLEKPTGGKIYYQDRDIASKDFSKKELRKKVGLVFQYPEHQLFEVSVIKDVSFGPKNLGLDEMEAEYRSYEALRLAGIGEDLIDASPLTLSGGQRRRVAIAGVLAMQPEVLILDEPTAGLDPAGREEILGLLQKLHRERKLTILLVSHSMDDIARYVERLLIMNRGEIVLDGEPGNVFQFEEQLSAIGLGVPQSAHIMGMLRKEGLSLERLEVTAEKAAEAIAEAMKTGHGQGGDL